MLKIAKTSYEEIMEKEFQTIVDEKEGQDSSEIFASNVCLYLLINVSLELLLVTNLFLDVLFQRNKLLVIYLT